MKTHKSIAAAFFLNLSFALLELVGGILTGSMAIASDALHDLGDAFSIGIAFLLERKSLRPADEKYTFGYGRYSVLGAALSSTLLLIGSLFILCSSVNRILSPAPVHYRGMILIAVIGVLVNTIAVWITTGRESLNKKAIHLHMLEDVLGWLVVLVGAIVIRFTNWTILDPIMSIILSIFIAYHGYKHLSSALHIVLEKVPESINLQKIIYELKRIPGVNDVHHLHIWSLDGYRHCATVHVVSNTDVKEAVRNKLNDHNIQHVTLELESTNDICFHRECHISSVQEYNRHSCHK